MIHDQMFQSQFLADAPLKWRHADQQFPRPDPFWRDWLLETGSLTRRLKELSQGTFRVNVLAEGWVLGTGRQALLFGQHRSRQLLWSRHVELCLYDKPWVAAHSLIPLSSLRGSLRQLVKLRDRPLGGFLFDQPGLKRSEPELVCLDGCWGRRSVFSLQRNPLLVAELFLPAMVDGLRDKASK